MEIATDNLIKLKNYWDKSGVRYQSPATIKLIEQFQDQNHILLPNDVLGFYSMFNGFDDGAVDNDIISFWSLQRIKRVPDILSDYGGMPDYREIVHNLPNNDNYFVFADFLSFSHVYAVKLLPNRINSQVIWISSGKDFGNVTNTFSEFISLYLVSPGNLNNEVLKLC